MDFHNEFQVGTLRARTTGPSPPSVRLSVTRALEVADLPPPGLAPREVLIVKRIEDPLPGAFGVRGPPAGNRDWARALRSRLEALYRGAARPRNGRITADCEAVVFANRAELLACLARDLVQGVAWQHWWWQALLARWPAGVVPSKAVVALLADEPEQLPAVIAQLHASGDSERVLNGMDAGDALVLVQALAASFGLAVVAGELSHGANAFLSGGEATPPGREHGSAAERRLVPDRSQPDSGARSVHDDTGGPVPAHTGATAESAPRVAEPLFAEVRRTRLARERQLLLGLALVLARRPWAARAESFQREVLHQWWRAARGPDEAEEPARAIDRQSPAAESAAASNEPAGVPREPIVTATGALSDAPPANTEDVTRVPSPSAALRARATAGTPAAAERPARRRARSRNDDAVREPVGTVRPSPGLAVAPTQPALADPVTSEFAGVLYLIDLMTALELPDCFEDDWRLASRLGPWALLETLGRALLEAAAIDATADPLWPWLAALDGRPPGEPLGRDLAVPPAYRLPRAWVDAGGVRSDTYYMAQAVGRLRLWSADYLLAEVPRDAQALDTQAAVELGRIEPGADRTRLQHAYWRTAPLARLRLAAAGPALRRFVACVLPFLRYRLALALGEQAAEPGTIAALLRCRARLYASPSHVDLVAPLDAISLPARLAGLDRDPGWQPSLGRVVSFRFE